MLESNFLIQEVVKRYDGNESSKILALLYYFLLLYGTNLYCVPSLLDHTTMFNFSPFNHALLDLQQLMEASYEIWFVHPVCLDILLSICLSGCFLGIKSLVFSKFWHIVKNPYEDEYNIAGSLEGKHLPQNLGKWTKYETKKFFFSSNLLKNSVIILFRTCSIMKVYVVCYIPVQISYLREILFLIYEQKYF